MSATIDLWGKEFTVDKYRWSGPDDGWVELLNALLSPLGPSGADPNPDLHAAMDAVAELGGKVLRFDPTEWEEGVVY